ncbi:antitoxin Xre/MbcA/ParS toxin-binding domain-containing protein [Leifsonia poae]
MLWGSAGVLPWLTSANSFLDGATPMDVLRLRGSRDVVDALDAEQAGSYA